MVFCFTMTPKYTHICIYLYDYKFVFDDTSSQLSIYLMNVGISLPYTSARPMYVPTINNPSTRK